MENVFELLTIAVASFGIGLSGAMMPGPVMTVTLAHVGTAGKKAGPLVTLGHAIVETILVVALAFGAGNFLAGDTVSGTIAVVGGFVLIWMGRGMITEAKIGAVDDTANGRSGRVEPAKMPGPVLGGMLASLANPYWYIWWATVGFSSITLVQQWGGLGIVAFFGGHILADFGWLTAVSIGFHHGKRFMSARVYQRIIIGLGIFLIFFSGVFLIYGVTRLL